MRTRVWRWAALLAVLLSLVVSGAALAADGHDGDVEFRGIVTALPSGALVGDWQVNGMTVKVTATTTINQDHGQAAVGALVEVQGTRNADRTVTATKIEVLGIPSIGERNEIVGIIMALPQDTLIGDWKVNMMTVHVTDATTIDQEDGKAVVGALVKVKGERQSDGSLKATEIEVLRSPARGSTVKFYGIVKSLPTPATKVNADASLVGDWKVGDVVVHVSAATEIDQEHGAVTVGALVEVSGVRRQDGSVDARQIEVKLPKPTREIGVNFPGVVEALPDSGLIGVWTVSNRKVQVTADTEINQEHGAVAVGAYVQVKGVLGADGVVKARSIEVKAKPPVGGGVSARFHGPVASMTTPTDGKYDITVKVGDNDVRLVHVGPRTRVEGTLAVGKTVEVKGIRQADASVDALSIEVQGADDNVKVKPTPQPKAENAVAKGKEK